MARRKLHKGTKARLVLQHGDACHICSLRMRFESPSNHPLSATYDHLVPRSKNGSFFKRTNIKLAHRLCNIIRGDRLLEELDEQLRARCKSAIQDYLNDYGF